MDVVILMNNLTVVNNRMAGFCNAGVRNIMGNQVFVFYLALCLFAHFLTLNVNKLKA